MPAEPIFADIRSSITSNIGKGPVFLDFGIDNQLDFDLSAMTAALQDNKAVDQVIVAALMGKGIQEKFQGLDEGRKDDLIDSLLTLLTFRCGENSLLYPISRDCIARSVEDMDRYQHPTKLLDSDGSTLWHGILLDFGHAKP